MVIYGNGCRFCDAEAGDSANGNVGVVTMGVVAPSVLDNICEPFHNYLRGGGLLVWCKVLPNDPYLP